MHYKVLGPTLSGHADVSGYNLQDHVVVNSLVPVSSALGTRLPVVDSLVPGSSAPGTRLPRLVKRAVGNGEVR